MNKNTIKPTQDEKEQYFAAHWGQDVIKDVNNSGELCTYPVERSNMYRFEESHLELTSLADITDEDAIEVAKMTYGKNLNTADWGRYTLENDIPKGAYKMSIDVTDFLRSKGYAIPFRNYSVQDLQDFGWLKLIQKGRGVQDGD